VFYFFIQNSQGQLVGTMIFAKGQQIGLEVSDYRIEFFAHKPQAGI
jgi:hypothetical protein